MGVAIGINAREGGVWGVFIRPKGRLGGWVGGWRPYAGKGRRTWHFDNRVSALKTLKMHMAIPQPTSLREIAIPC